MDSFFILMRSSKKASGRRPNGAGRAKKHPNRVNFHPVPRPMNLAPPTYVAQENRSWMVRFSNNATSTLAGVFTMANLASMLGVIATGATTSVFLADQVRIRRICMWSPVATAGVPVSNSIKWVDDPASSITSGAPKTQNDSSLSFDRPAYVCLEPPKDASSIFSQWVDSSLTTQWVTVVAPAGTIMDIYYNFIVDDVGATSAGPTLVAATAGIIYHKIVVTGAATWTAVAPNNFI
jgi:hypothetical protein